MQLQPNIQTGSIAAVPHAAKRGGALQSRARELANAQKITTHPAGKAEGSDAVDAGDQAGDRHGDGRQPHDTFERSDLAQRTLSIDQDAKPPRSVGESSGVDYQA